MTPHHGAVACWDESQYDLHVMVQWPVGMSPV